MRRTNILLFFYFLLYILTSNSSFAQNSSHLKSNKNEAEKLWKTFNILDLKAEVKKITSDNNENIDLFFQTQNEYYYKFQHTFFDLVENKTLRRKTIKNQYDILLNHYLEEYKKFKINVISETTFDQNKYVNASCVNTDFEDGSLNGWNSYLGYSSTAINPGGLYLNSSQVNIVTGNNFDFYVGNNILPNVAPGGNYSVMIGNLSNGSQAARLSQTFVVQPSNAKFTYQFATVLEDGNHSINEQAYFKVKIKDLNGNILGCISDSLSPTYPYTDLKPSTSYTNYYYKNWTTRTIPLGNFIGQTVTIEFTVQDCTQGAHLGYAYIDGSCLPLQIVSSQPKICPGTTITLTAPDDYDSYFWTGPGIVGSNSSKTITINQPGNYQSIVKKGDCYSPVFIAVPGGGITSSSDQLCAGDTLKLTAPGGLSNYTWSGPGIIGSNNLPSITVNKPGTYNVSISGTLGTLCNSSYVISSVIRPNIGADLTICPGDTVHLNATGGSTVYSWSPNSMMLDSTTSHPSVHPNVTTTYIATTCNVKDTITVFLRNPIHGTTTGNKTNCNAFGIPIGIKMDNNEPYTYLWSPTTGLNGNSSATVIAAPTVTTTYNVKVNLGKNCLYEDSLTITVPYVSFLKTYVDQDSLCKGETVKINTEYYKNSGLNGTTCSGTTTTQIGNDITSSINNNQSLFNGNYLSSRFQLIFTVAELNAVGINSATTFSELGFKIDNVLGNNIYRNFTIKMGTTIKSVLTNSFVDGLSTVFNPKNIIINTGINFFTLDNTFDWDGKKNIIIEICYLNNSLSTNSSTVYSNTNFQSFLATSNNSACNSSTGTLSGYRPNIYFKHCASITSNPLTYSWTTTTGLDNATQANPIAAPQTSTTYHLIANDPISGCIYNDSVRITVDDPFTITLLDSIINCNSLGTLISATPSINGNFHYQWLPNNYLNNSSLQSPIASPISTTKYYVTITSEHGCSIQDSIKIVIPGRARFSISSNKDTLCNGQSAQLSSFYQKECGVNGSTCSGLTSVVQIGTSNINSAADNITIYKGAYKSSKTQLLYTKSELNALGLNGAKLITQIGFNIASISGNNIYKSFTIKMGCTSQTTINNPSFQTDLQTVFNTKNIIITNGINYHVLDHNFDWDGVSNIIIEICYNNLNTSVNSSIYYSTTTNPMMLYTSGNSVCDAITGLSTNNRPNLFFKYCNGTTINELNFSWTPVNTLDNAIIYNPIATPSANTMFTTTALDNSTGCVFKDSIYITKLSNDKALTLLKDTTICSGTAINLNAKSGYKSYLWNDGTTDSIKHISTAGTYWVRTIGNCNTQIDTCKIQLNNTLSDLNLGNDTTICNGIQKTFNAFNSNYSTYFWQNGSTNPTFTANTNGIYWVNVTNICGSKKDSVNLVVQYPTPVKLGNDTTLCVGSSILIGPSNIYSLYLWQNNSTSQYITANAPGLYFVKATNACGIYSDSILINYLAPPSIELGNDTSICNGNSIFLKSIGCSNCSYVWKNGTIGNNLNVNSAGTYSIKATNICGNYSDSIQISIINNPTVDLGSDFTFCIGDSALISSLFDSNYKYTWEDGSTKNSKYIDSPGKYWLTAENKCTQITDTIQIGNLHNLPLLELGNDTSICNYDTLMLSVKNPNYITLWQNGSTNLNQLITKDGTYSVIVTDLNNCKSSDHITVSLIEKPYIDLGDKLSICKETEYELELPFGKYNYVWQDGSTLNTINVLDEGNYSVSATNECGIYQDSVLIKKIGCICDVNVPSGFSPNKDGINDILYIRGNCSEGVRLYIYDRWGQKVFETDDVTIGWDGKFNGKELNNAVFFYYLSATNSYDGSKIEKKGNISLIK